MANFLFTPDRNNPTKIDPAKCRAAVYSQVGWKWHQCVRHGAIEREGVRYCRHHDPVALKMKSEARDTINTSLRAAAELRHRENRRGVEALAALRKIVAGHNDPRSLANEVLNAK